MATLGCGAALGLGLTVAAITARYDPAAIHVGSWTTWPGAGTPDIDPYARAIVARSGEVPMAAAEGTSFIADRDTAGSPLRGACLYRVTGRPSPVRLWTLTLLRPSGLAIDTPAGRSGLRSADLLRREDGSFVVNLGSSVQPGNWLPAPADGGFLLMLRVYGTFAGASPADLGRAVLPTIERLACEG